MGRVSRITSVPTGTPQGGPARSGMSTLTTSWGRPLLGARGDLVQVRRKRECSSPPAQLESCLHVEAIVNSCVEPRQACLLGDGCQSSTLAWEGGGEYAAIRAREAGVGGRVRRVLRRREHRHDQLARDSHEGSLGPRRLVHVPVVRDVDLLLGPVDRDLINLGQRRVESSASKYGWRRRPQLTLGREKEGTRAEVAACD